MDKISPEYCRKYPSGVECIDITKHYSFSISKHIKYTWKFYINQEDGYFSIEKEIKDLNKILRYVQDRIKQLENEKETKENN